ncbi:MAG: histidinol dehydrogenase, partial [Magnetococcus sp. WYHC-3]
DTAAQSILLTPVAHFADRVAVALADLVQMSPRREICRQSLRDRGMIVVVRDWDEACRLASQAAPEHLELAVEDPETLLPRIQHAGAIFLGRHTPEAIGDYVAGPNHVLPTGGTARFSSPLGVYDFLKRTSLIGCPASTLQKIGPAAAHLARREGLDAHRLSVALRLDDRSTLG